MKQPMNITVRDLRRLRAVLKSRSKEAKPCPDVCIVLPPSFGFRPGDWFKARYVDGSLIVTNTRKLTAKERQVCGGELTSQIENANWSSRLLPCPMCGSRATLWPDVPEGQPPGFGRYEVRCCGCGVRTAPMQYRKAEDVVAAWNWCVRLLPQQPIPTDLPTKAPKGKKQRVEIRALTPEYVRREYGVTEKEWAAFKRRMDREIAAERKAGTLKPYTGTLKPESKRGK